MFYKVEEVAKMLDLHPDTVRRYIRERKIDAYKVGKGFRIKEDDLDEYLEEIKY